MDTQNADPRKNFLSCHLFELGNQEIKGIFEKKLKSPFTCLNWERVSGHPKMKNFENKKEITFTFR
ncbi:MAG: hypothetical protein Q4C55_09425 [Eubacterium sp.]|nr:hypothetical protein [Eubacterium sp.]